MFLVAWLFKTRLGIRVAYKIRTTGCYIGFVNHDHFRLIPIDVSIQKKNQAYQKARLFLRKVVLV